MLASLSTTQAEFLSVGEQLSSDRHGRGGYHAKGGKGKQFRHKQPQPKEEDEEGSQVSLA